MSIPSFQEPAKLSSPPDLAKALRFILGEPSVSPGFTQGKQFSLSSKSIILSGQTEARKPYQKSFMWQGSMEPVICLNGGKDTGKIQEEKLISHNFN